jgi:hypothetical protein
MSLGTTRPNLWTRRPATVDNPVANVCVARLSSLT